MRIKRTLFWSAFGLFTLLILTATWLWTADLGSFKPQLERWVSEKTGREFAIDGVFTVDLSAHTVVIANDIRFQNADWADDPQMLEIGRAEIRVDLWSFFSGPFLVELIDVNDVELRLVRPNDHDANWELPLGKEAGADSEDDADAGFDVLFKLLDIDRVHVIYDAPDRDKPLDLRVEYLDQRHRDDNYLEVELQATLGGRDIRLDGEVGTLAALLAGQDINFSFESQLDTFEIEGKGWVDDVAELRRPSLEFSARGPDIDDLMRLLALGQETEGDINISGALTPQQDGPLVLDVQGNIGQTNIEATGAFSDLQDLEQLEFDLLASGPDLGRLLRLVGIDEVREAPFMIDVNAQRDGTMLDIEQAHMVFADAEFDVSGRIPNFPSADDAAITVKISGPDIERFRYVTRLPGTATGAFSAGFELTVEPSGGEVFKLDLTTSLGKANASGQLGEAPDYIGSTVDIQVKGKSLARLGDAYGIENLPQEEFSVQGSAVLAPDGIRISGPLTASIEQISVSLEGLITLSDGIIGSDLSFGLVGSDLAALTGAVGVTEGIPGEPIDISGALRVGKDAYRIENVSGTLGRSALNIDGLLMPDNGLSGSRIKFSASGPAFEELIAALGASDVRPGPYELSGEVVLQSDLIEFNDIVLDREAGNVSVDMELGLPVSRRWANFSLRADGSDVRSVFRRIEAYEAEEASFFVDTRGELRQSNLSLDKLDIGVGDARIQARGDLDFGDDGSSTRFSFSGNIPSLSQLGSYDERRLRDQAITWDANITGGNGVLTVDNLNLKLGESDVRGVIRYENGDVPEIGIDIHSESIVFGPLFEEKEIEYVAEPEFADDRLIPDTPIPFDTMRKLNLSIQIDIKEFVRNSLRLRNIDLEAELRDGALDISRAGFNAHSGWFQGRANVDPADGTGKLSMEMVARNLNFGLSKIDADHPMVGDLDIGLESTGVDARALAGNATGVMFADMRGGRLANDNRALQAIYGDVLDEILKVINPFYKADPYTNIHCIVLAFEVNDGKVTSAPNSLFSTDKIRVVPTITTDLKTEALNIDVRMRPQKGLTFSSGELFNSFVKITGSLAKPRLAVDEAGALISGGAAVATAGLSILAGVAWDRLSRSKDPCGEAAGKGKEILSDRFPKLAEPPSN